MVLDIVGGPQWMLYEPLLNNAGGAAAMGNLTDPATVQLIGKEIDDAVGFNATHVWFNLMFAGSYAPFLQILCQTWGSILSKTWINNVVIPAGRPDWNGNWADSHAGWGKDHTGWIDVHGSALSPLDSTAAHAGWLMMGSGPFKLRTLDTVNKEWIMDRNVNYWAGFPASFPTMACASPKGYVNVIHSTWAFVWANRKAMFLNGDIDFVAVPRANIPELFQSSSPPYAPPNYPLDGIRCIFPLPSLAVDAMFYEFTLDPTTPYTTVGPAGVFNENNIPVDFFGNATWGIHVRKAFASAFDYSTFLSTAYLGEAFHPATALIPGLRYYDPTVAGWTYNLTNAVAEFKQVPGLWDTGFTITVLYNTGNLPRSTACNLLKAAIEGLNPKFHVIINGIAWATYLDAMYAYQLPIFIIGWLADYPDAHNFVSTFYGTYGSFSYYQGYSNPTMDDLIDKGIKTPDGPARQAIYTQIQKLAITDCPSTTIDQAQGRHFERDWVVGWYYDPVYSGNLFYNLWKWYYQPHASLSTSVQPTSFSLPADTNYDGKIDMKDIGVTAKSFGSAAGPPIGTNWVFRVDFNNDRKIDMKDIGFVAKNFGKSSAVWTPTT
jgi:peptide/nickel transport system substrate-binding protein